jgi:tetratricopeptide (TPR) repeat protein
MPAAIQTAERYRKCGSPDGFIGRVCTPGDRVCAPTDSGEDVVWQVALASVCVVADDLTGARVAIEEALDRPPADPAETNLLGLLHFGQGRVARAREVYLRALGRWGDWASLLFNIAVCDLRLGMLAEARMYLERLVAMRPRHRRAWACLGIVYTRMGEDDLARAAMARARESMRGSVGPARRQPQSASAMRPRAPDFFVLQPPREIPLPSARSVDEAMTRLVGVGAETPLSRDAPGGFWGARAWGVDAIAEAEALAPAELLLGDEDDEGVLPQLPQRAPHPSLVDDALVFVPRSVPVGPPQESARPWYASRVVAAVLAAAAGFALATGLGKRATPRFASSVAPVRTAPPAPATAAAAATAQPLRRESGTLREAPLTVRVAATEAPVPSTGVLNTPESARGHRVFVDGRCRGGAGDPIKLPCGPHEVRVGSAGRKQQVVVPCGGEIDVPR